ncbi:MAG: ATP-binding cassette domain-containing protein [Deltaproteobacteria bacterium]|nr:ATP-binding cassette domain-containing protein [Deltaproteobacteria bacterium]
MSDIVIKVDNLSKQYRIGAREGYKTFRETLVDAAKAPFKRLGAAWSLAHGPWRKRGDPTLPASRSPLSSPDDTIWALKDVSFEVKHGEVIGIIGNNGAGKTTLLKVLSKITEPTEGRVELRGRVGSLLEVGTGFHPELTGHENIYLYGAILGMDRWEVSRKFDEIVNFAELEKFIDTPVKRYSSGMYMRLAFAVAAHLEPEILLVDEVLAVGDASFQKKCLGKMGDVSKEGRTVLFVSHNMAAVEQLCSRGILLTEGHIQKSGNINKVVEFYLSEHKRSIKDVDRVLANGLNGSLEIISLCPVDRKGQNVSMVQCGRNMDLSITLRTTIHLPKVTISVGINNIHDLRIAVLHSDIAGYGLELSPGSHSVICSVPHFPLSAGSYVLDLKIISGKEERVGWILPASAKMGNI